MHEDIVAMEWVNIQSNSGAKCREEGGKYEHHDIKKGEKTLLIEGDASDRHFKIHLCLEHGVELLEQAANLLHQYVTDPNAQWNQPNDYGERPGDICCMRASGKRCYEHDYQNYKKKERNG